MGNRRFAASSGNREANIAKANKGGFITKKMSLIVYVLVLILAVAARTYQLFTNMDFDRNRYIDPSLAKNYPLFIIAGGLVLIALVLGLGNARDKVIKSCILINPMRLRYDRLNKKIPASAGYSAVLMAVLVAAQIVFDFVDIVHRNNKVIETLTMDEREDYSKLTGYNLGLFAEHLLMFFVILTFISIAVNIFKGEGFSSPNCAALMTYAVWQIVQIFILMDNNPAMVLSSECIYEMLSRMLAVLFFLNTARFFNGMEKKNTRFWMCLTGYAASILAAVSVIPRYILLLIPDKIDDRLGMNIPAIADVGIVFMTITLIAVFWSTYVYRVMPKLNVGNRRWSRAPMNRNYRPMEDIEIQDPEGKI